MYRVAATFNPSVLQAAVKKVQANIQSAKGYLFIAAIDGKSDLYNQQACAPQTLSENEPATRIVVGVQGQSWNHVFADVPAIDVDEAGYFLIDKTNELLRWLKESQERTSMTYTEAQDGSKTLHLDYASGHDKLPIKMYYTKDAIGRSFQAHTHRFVTPDVEGANTTLAAMLQRSYKTAETTKSVDRSGDLMFAEADDGTVEAEFMAVQRFDAQMVVTCQRAKIGNFPIGDVRWEVSPTDLSLLKDLFAKESVSVNIETQTFDDDTSVKLFQAAYSEPFESGGTMYVQRQATVVSKSQPLRRNVGPQILRNEESKLYATANTDEFFRQLRKTWALRTTAIIESVLQEASRENPARMRLQTYGGRGSDQSDQKRLSCIIGDSSIGRYRFFKNANGVIEKITKGSNYIQIRSYATEGEEIESGYIVVPVRIPEDEDFSKELLTGLPEWPTEYLFISWAQN